MAPQITIRGLSESWRLREYLQPEENTNETSLPDVKGGYYDVDVDVSLFITRFVKEDVEDFLSFFSRNPSVPNRLYLCNLVTNVLSQWINNNPTRCPYEPFLWALKIHDNYVGSLKGQPQPDHTLLNPVAEALKSKWNPEYRTILKNIILNWDWYQPIHVALKLYEMLEDFNDPEIDEKIANHWLYDYMYSVNAYMCLLGKKKTNDNIAAIMRYISRDSYDDDRIKITNRTRTGFINYARTMSPDEDGFAYSFYRNSLSNCSRRARQEAFDKVWAPSDHPDSHLENIVNAYKVAETENQRQRAVTDFRTLCLACVERPQNGRFQDGCLAQIIHTLLPEELKNEVINIFEQKAVGSLTQHILNEMLKNSSQQYHTYIIEKYRKVCRNGINNAEGLLYASAYCYVGHHPELIDDIIRKFFLEGKGFIQLRGGHSVDIARYNVFSLRVIYSTYYNESVERLAETCINDVTNTNAIALVNNCKNIFTTRPTNNCYPIVFDKVLKHLVKAIINNDRDAPRYASLVVELIERVAAVLNRGRYYDMLMDILRTNSPQLNTARREANRIIHRLYGAASV